MKKSKKIVCTVTNDLTYDQRMIRICSTLAQAGYEVLLVGRKRRKSLPLEEETFQQIRLNCFFDKGKWFYIEYNLRLFLFLIRHPYDGVCAVDLDTLLPAFICCRLRNKQCIYDAHEYFTEVPEVNRRPFIKKIWETLAAALIPRIKYAYTVGPGLASIFKQKYNTNFNVIRNVPIRWNRVDQIDKENDLKIILYQGALNEGRGLETAIEAMKQIDEAVLWLAGEGDLSDSLRQQVQREGLNNKVQFLGYIKPRDLKTLTPKAYIGLNLLENKGLSYYYSLANKAFDYIQASVPSIHQDFPEYRHLNEQYDTFVLLSLLDVSELVAAIKKLLNDEIFYDRLKNNCESAASILNWDREASKLIDFYHQIWSTKSD
jgi:glycosyltransferase involved in cell wall biosynthesis